MLKFLRNKIQSLTITQQNILTAILILFNVGIVIFWISFFIRLQKPPPPIVEKPPVEGIPESFRPGEIGEIPEEEMKEKEILPLPSQIFNTSGTILEVKTDRIIIQGDGSNFSDREPRTLNIIFTDSTIINLQAKKIYYQGLEGLKYLKPGMETKIEGGENIKGKTEFKASIINIL